MKYTYILWDTQPFIGYLRFVGRIVSGIPQDGTTLSERLDVLLIKYPTLTKVLLDSSTPIPDRELVKWNDATQSFTPLLPEDVTPKMTEDKKHSDAAIQLKLNSLSNKTFEQVENYIDNNITDLASQIQFDKDIGKILLAVLKVLNYSD